jgi:hypothetical protein
MTDERTMKVSIAAMLYAVSNMLKKVKGQELTASLFYEFIDTYEGLQREIRYLRSQVAEQEAIIIKQNESNPEALQALSDENKALLEGNANIIAHNRELQETLTLRTTQRDYWDRAAKEWRQDFFQQDEKFKSLQKAYELVSKELANLKSNEPA